MSKSDLIVALFFLKVTIDFKNKAIALKKFEFDFN